jgi:hypothetical protein
MAISADSVEFGTTYNYPASSVYFELVGRDSAGTQQKIHIIIYNGTASITTSQFNGAPKGSLLIDLQATNADWYVHDTTTAWTVVGSLT